ncbi:MAG: YaaA family protein [Ilumatobacteraceae bacterium]
MFILLPPSEGKADGGRPGTAWEPSAGPTGRALGPMREQVAPALARARGGDQKLLGVKGAALESARAANTAVLGAPTLPAWQRYTGVVWDHLDLASLPGAARTAAVKRILVPSALLGVVRGDEPTPDYKLKMGAVLAGTGRLSRWWRAALTEEIVRLTRGALIVNLLPQEHSDAVDWEALGEGRVVHVDLVSRTKGGRVGGHDAKAAKGALARRLIDAAPGATVTRTLAGFRHPQYAARIR